MKNFLFILTIVFLTVTLAWAESYSAKIYKPDPDNLVVNSGGKINMKSGGSIVINGTIAPAIAPLAVATLNPTPVGTAISGAVVNLENTTNSLISTLQGLGALPTNTPTATPTP